MGLMWHLGVVGLSSEDFRRHVEGRAALGGGERVSSKVAREPKVCDLEAGAQGGLAQQQVGRLQVAAPKETKNSTGANKCKG